MASNAEVKTGSVGSAKTNGQNGRKSGTDILAEIRAEVQSHRAGGLRRQTITRAWSTKTNPNLVKVPYSEWDAVFAKRGLAQTKTIIKDVSEQTDLAFKVVSALVKKRGSRFLQIWKNSDADPKDKTMKFCSDINTGDREWDKRMINLLDGKTSKLALYKETTVDDYTLVATSKIHAEEPVCAISGILRETEEFNREFSDPTCIAHLHAFSYDLELMRHFSYTGCDVVLDTSKACNVMTFASDSNWNNYGEKVEPNVGNFVVWDAQRNVPAIVAYAQKDILPGEEIFVDVGTREWEENQKETLLKHIALSHFIHAWKNKLVDTLTQQLGKVSQQQKQSAMTSSPVVVSTRGAGSGSQSQLQGLQEQLRQKEAEAIALREQIRALQSNSDVSTPSSMTKSQIPSDSSVEPKLQSQSDSSVTVNDEDDNHREVKSRGEAAMDLRLGTGYLPMSLAETLKANGCKFEDAMHLKLGERTIQALRAVNEKMPANSPSRQQFLNHNNQSNTQVMRITDINHPCRYFTPPNDHSHGLWATKPFRKSEYVCVYRGILYEEDKFYDSGAETDQMYAMQINMALLVAKGYTGQPLVVEALRCGNEARFINDWRHRKMGRHTINCELKALWDEERCIPVMAIRTTRQVKVGEELVLDYGDHFWRASRTHCQKEHTKFANEMFGVCNELLDIYREAGLQIPQVPVMDSQFDWAWDFELGRAVYNEPTITSNGGKKFHKPPNYIEALSLHASEEYWEAVGLRQEEEKKTQRRKSKTKRARRQSRKRKRSSPQHSKSGSSSSASTAKKRKSHSKRAKATPVKFPTRSSRRLKDSEAAKTQVVEEKKHELSIDLATADTANECEEKRGQDRNSPVAMDIDDDSDASATIIPVVIIVDEPNNPVRSRTIHRHRQRRSYSGNTKRHKARHRRTVSSLKPTTTTNGTKMRDQHDTQGPLGHCEMTPAIQAASYNAYHVSRRGVVFRKPKLNAGDVALRTSAVKTIRMS